MSFSSSPDYVPDSWIQRSPFEDEESMRDELDRILSQDFEEEMEARQKLGE